MKNNPSKLNDEKVIDLVGIGNAIVEDYGVANRDMAIETLESLLESELSRDGALTISVEGSSPTLAANIANSLAAELDAVIRKNKRQQADGLRLFLSDRMETVQGEIEAKARSIRDFQEGKGVVDVQAQTAAMVCLLYTSDAADD